MMSDRTLRAAMDKHYRQPHMHPDEQLLREALGALKALTLWSLERGVPEDVRVIKNGLATITKLEERLLRE